MVCWVGKLNPQIFMTFIHKKTFLTHHTLVVKVGARQSAPYCHLGTQNNGGSTTGDIASHSDRGTETFQCPSLDLHMPLPNTKDLGNPFCHLPGKEEGTS